MYLVFVIILKGIFQTGCHRKIGITLLNHKACALEVLPSLDRQYSRVAHVQLCTANWKYCLQDRGREEIGLSLEGRKRNFLPAALVFSSVARRAVAF